LSNTSVSRWTQARGDLADAVAVVDGGREQAHLLALLFVVVRHLQHGGGFACVHRRVSEIEFCHCKPSVDVPLKPRIICASINYFYRPD
jgi:hypothetical protein